jgi:hypothetical protein
MRDLDFVAEAVQHMKIWRTRRTRRRLHWANWVEGKAEQLECRS